MGAHPGIASRAVGPAVFVGLRVIEFGAVAFEVNAIDCFPQSFFIPSPLFRPGPKGYIYPLAAGMTVRPRSFTRLRWPPRWTQVHF